VLKTATITANAVRAYITLPFRSPRGMGAG
jgi:hypothetical protein